MLFANDVSPSTVTPDPTPPVLPHESALRERKRLRLSICRMWAAAGWFLLWALHVVVPSMWGYAFFSRRLVEVLSGQGVVLSGAIFAGLAVLLWLPTIVPKALDLAVLALLCSAAGGLMALNTLCWKSYWLTFVWDGAVWTTATHIGHGLGSMALLSAVWPAWQLFADVTAQWADGRRQWRLRSASPPADPAEFEHRAGWDEGAGGAGRNDKG